MLTFSVMGDLGVIVVTVVAGVWLPCEGSEMVVETEFVADSWRVWLTCEV